MTATRIARWTATLLLVLTGLWLLNNAFFSAWMAGSPLSEHKLGWERRSLALLSLSVAAFLAAAAVFRAMPRMPRIGKLAWILALAAAGFAAVREVLIDACLDSGGRWSHDLLECLREPHAGS